MERFYQKTTADETNYLVQGDILRVYSFKYENAYYVDQHWTFVGDTIVLKDAPDADIQLDITYLREVELVVDNTDEIDLPDQMSHDFLELVKKKLLVDYAGEDEIVYQNALTIAERKSNKKNFYQNIEGVKRSWFIDSKGDFLYDITDNYVGQENVTADVHAHYYFV